MRQSDGKLIRIRPPPVCKNIAIIAVIIIIIIIMSVFQR
jgi:hypothetical protein